MIESHPALDAEKTSTSTLMTRFRVPPGAHDVFARNTLLVGNRGSGKTMLLRWKRHDYNGTAIYGDLKKIVNSVSSDTGLGGIAWRGLSPNNEAAATAKTISLIAYWFAAQCNKRNVRIPTSVFRRTLPRSLREHELDLDELYEDIFYSPLEQFARGPTIDSLLELLNEVGDSTEGSRLLILLDRAELVPYPSLSVVLSLLDQSHSFMTVVASRPGLIAMKGGKADVPVPGDHYAVHHLGASPYSHEWVSYTRSILGSWLPKSISAISKERLGNLLWLSRDSLRSALKITHGSVGAKHGFDYTMYKGAIFNLRDNLLSAAQGYLRDYNPDIRRLLREIRRTSPGGLVLPIELSPPGRETPILFQANRSFGELSREEKFIYLALRCGMITTLHGEPWHPDSTYRSFELNPLLIWDEGDKWSNTLPTP